jgi:heme exporter protein D
MQVAVRLLMIKRTLILCLIFSIFLVASVQAYFEAFTISAFGQATRKVELQGGETITGTVRSKGAGQNDSINFYITDSDGNTILRYDNKSDISFSFTVVMTGNYTLHFDNTHSTIPKGITLKYSTESQVFGIPQDLFYTILAVVIIVVAIVIAAVILVLRRRRHLKQQEKESLTTRT